MKYQLSEIAKICNGKLIGADCTVDSLLTDSRRAGGGAQTLFVAMKGKNHDSHDFIPEMARRGTKAFLVERQPSTAELEGSFVVVENSITALQALAAHHRSTLRGVVVAVVGSNGKTMVKEWIAQSYLGSGRLYRSPRSYNSQLGVAISLLLTSGHEELVIIEAGVSRQGEMQRLEEMIRPDIVVVTSIGDAHQEGFASTKQKIEEKLIIARRAKKVIFHSYYTQIESYFKEHPHNYTLLDAAEQKGGDLTESTAQRNSQLTEALLKECGCSSYDLSAITPVAMRLEVKEGINDSVVVNDSYNSCVNSLSIALDTLNSVAATRPTTLILSPILQSGVSPEELYAKVNKVIKAAKVDRVIGVGSQINRWIECDYFASTEELLSKMSREDFAHRAILLKGNRGSRFERISHSLEKRSHTTRLEVDLDAMVENLNYFRQKLQPQTKLIAMVKANSYGAGDYEIAQMLQEQGVDYLAVAFVDEGVKLRERGITMPIIVLNADDDSFEPMIQMRLEPEIYSLRSLRDFTEALKRNAERNYPIHLKIDSGMHRLGFNADEVEAVTEQIAHAADQLYVASVFSHLSSADEPCGSDYTRKQIELFDAISQRICEGIGYNPTRHIANSAAIESYPQAHFDGCRLGIGLYGFGLSEQHLTPIATLKSRIVQIKEYAAGSVVGYGGAGEITRESKIATVPIGYADGLRRDLGCGKWAMRVNGAAAPIVGRVCMDSVMIDVTKIKDISEGDEVVIFSADKGNTVADMAKILGTIPYEILTSISQRVKRVYLKE